MAFQDFDELMHLIMQSSAQERGDRRLVFYGHIVSYDPVNHAVKVQLPAFRENEDSPGAITGWLPLGSHYVGAGFGMQFAPVPDASGVDSLTPTGTPCEIVVNDRDGSATVTALRFNDKNLPPFPTIQPGEGGIKHGSGTYFYFANSGNFNLEAAAVLLLAQIASGSKLQFNQDGSITLNTGESGSGKGALQINGNTDWAVMANKLLGWVNNHTHSGVQTGSGTSGPPASPASVSDVASTTVNIGQ